MVDSSSREVIRIMVKVIEIGETVYGCGTGGFLAQSYQHMKEKARTAIEPSRPDGRENLIQLPLQILFSRG